MQDVDRPPHVQTLAQPPRDRGPRVQVEPVCLVSRSKDPNGIAGYLRRRRHVGENSAVRATEPKVAVRLAIDLIAFLVDGAVVAATEHREIRECGRAALCPVTDVMPLAEADPAAREAAAPVSVEEGPP
jgi:hypothetical protein